MKQTAVLYNVIRLSLHVFQCC